MSKKDKKNQHPADPPDFARFQKDAPEPVVQRGSFPVWLIAVVVLLFYWADMYVVTHGADLGGKGGAFPVTVYDPYKSHQEVEEKNPEDPGEAMFKLGGRIYWSKGCSTCHGPGGTGTPGQFPPLTGSEWVLTQNPGRIIRIVNNGLTGPINVRGQSYNNAMPPFNHLDDKEVAAVLTYIRNEWGNKASPVTVEQVKQVRREIGGRVDSFTAAELEQVPVQ